MPRPLPLVCLALAALAGGCAAPGGRTPVLFTTDPPGAAVILDGTPSGFATPCQIGLPLDEGAIQVELVKDGFVTAVRALEVGTHTVTVLWSEMNVGHRAWRFPLHLNADDSFVPVRAINPIKPARVFVRLARSADSEP
ncbi:MAG: PEGA domain-containing protein [Planctomycetota bacterium]|nr:PEGA domain-containing protein [Planctomycetota bacterium]MDP6763687.1 PEGA domain-containing protein [Planctomycetota bacterium]MDP6989480.1 PEGA domain-containing protein [Planctomycetota bacterium]